MIPLQMLIPFSDPQKKDEPRPSILAAWKAKRDAEKALQKSRREKFIRSLRSAAHLYGNRDPFGRFRSDNS